MEFFRIKRDIPFMRHALVLNVVSVLTFIAAVFFIATRGLHLSIEFTGGTVIELAYSQTADIGKTRATVESLDLGEVQVQNFGSSRELLIRLPARAGVKQSDLVSRVFDQLCKAEGHSVSTQEATSDKGESISKPVCGTLGSEPIRLQRSEFVGPSVGAEMATDGAMALAATVLGIMIYLALRFEWKFSVAGILANLHDVVIIVG
ncbi:MAG: protein translocase subunit SecF, partial [Burkholderiaceae bacterium]|nr:protein translocase subunit SecF [Burkholderiaceae bacterium]